MCGAGGGGGGGGGEEGWGGHPEDRERTHTTDVSP